MARSSGDTCPPPGAGRESELAGGVAHDQDRAIVLEQRERALVVVDATVDETHGVAVIQRVELQRGEEAWHAGAGADGLGQRHGSHDLALGILVVGPPQPGQRVGAVDDRERGFAHRLGREMPGVAGVQRCRVHDQVRDLRRAEDVVITRVEVGVVARRHDAERRHLRIGSQDGIVLRGAAVQRRPDRGGHAVGVDGVVAGEDCAAGLEVGQQGGPQVGVGALAEIRDQCLDELEVVVTSWLGFLLQQVPHAEVVGGANHRATRHGRQRRDVAQQIRLREPGEHAQVIQRGAKAAAGKGQADFSDQDRLDEGGAGLPLADQRLDHPGRVGVGEAAERPEPRDLIGRGAALPGIGLQRRGDAEQTLGLGDVAEPEPGLGERRMGPVVARGDRLRDPSRRASARAR